MHLHALPALLDSIWQLGSGSPPSQECRCPPRGWFAAPQPIAGGSAAWAEQGFELHHLRARRMPEPLGSTLLLLPFFFFLNLNCKISQTHLEAVGSSERLDFPLWWGRNLVLSPTGCRAQPLSPQGG